MNGPVKQEASTASNMSNASAPQQGLMDPIDSLLDLSDYDSVQQQFQSPAMSPSNSKNTFVRASTASTSASILPSSQPMSGPSHPYNEYKQHTGFVPGALATTYQTTAPMPGQFGSFDMGYMPVASSEDMFDFNTSPNNQSVSPSDIGLDFESPASDRNYYFADGQPAGVVPGQGPIMTSPSVMAANGSQGANVRLWPGMHQQAAIAKAQAQQRQQQQIIQQQQQRQQVKAQSQPPSQQVPHLPGQRTKSAQPADPIVEQKITQLLNSMRQKPSDHMPHNNGNLVNISRSRKEEDDMDEDERLLASDEGKKLTSKERRQLRNKVSARAFRSRRKEYISQLEAEIAGKVNENGDLRTQNRALLEENKRLSDLTRMLLGSPSFSDFLDRLSSNPSLIPQSQQQPQAAPQPQERQAPKDVNPYAAQQQIGMAMIPEQNVDLSMLQMEHEPIYSFQPQVFNVHTPETHIAALDTSLLSGKTSNFVGSAGFEDEEKIDMPMIEHLIVEKKEVEAVAAVPVDEEFENDPCFALYHDVPASSTAASSRSAKLNGEMKSTDIFGGLDTEKAFARYELVEVASAKTVEIDESIAIARINVLASNLKAITSRLDVLIPDF